MDVDFFYNFNDFICFYNVCYKEGNDVVIGLCYKIGVNVVNWFMSRVLMLWLVLKYV